MDDGQVIRDAAFVLNARLQFDELVALVWADLSNDRAVAELHHWLDEPLRLAVS